MASVALLVAGTAGGTILAERVCASTKEHCLGPIIQWTKLRFSRQKATFFQPSAIAAGKIVRQGNRQLFRDDTTGLVYTVELEEVRTALDGTGLMNVYKTSRLAESESILVWSSPFIRPLKPVPGFVVEIGLVDSAHVFRTAGYGYRDHDWLVTARHVLDKPGGLLYGRTEFAIKVRGPDGVIVQVKPESKYVPAGPLLEFSGLDVMAVKLPSPSWAASRVQKISDNAFCANAEGPVVLYGRYQGKTVQADGEIFNDPNLSKKIGLIPHSCSTDAGFSGTPIMVDKNGQMKVVGMHICGDVDNVARNYAVSVAVLQLLRHKIGIAPMPERVIPSESPEPVTRQMAIDYDFFDLPVNDIRTSREQYYGDLVAANKRNNIIAAGGRLRQSETVNKETPEPVLDVAIPAALQSQSVFVKLAMETPVVVPESYTMPVVIAEGRGFDLDSVVTDWLKTESQAAWDLLLSCSPTDVLQSDPFMAFRYYMGRGNIKWLDVPGNVEDNLRKVASIDPAFAKSAPSKTLSPDFVEAMRKASQTLGCEIEDDWVFPPVGPDACLKSLRGQLRKRQTKKWTEQMIIDIDSVAEEMAKKAPVVEEPLKRSFHHSVLKIYAAMDMTKSAGWSQRLHVGTKGAWAEQSKLEMLSYLVRCRMLLRHVWGVKNVGAMAPSDLVRHGLRDPEEQFVKQEPHSHKKQLEERWRLIWNCSLVDAVLQGIAHKESNEQAILKFQNDPTSVSNVVGMGHSDEGIQQIGCVIERLQEHGLPVEDSDASGWDISVAREAYLMDASIRIKQTKHAEPAQAKQWEDLVNLEALVASAHVIALGSSLYEIVTYGIVSSGMLSTTSNNSKKREAIARVSGAVDVMNLSDDLVVAGKVDYEKMQTYGPVTKAIHPCDDCVEFTSHRFTKQGEHWHAEFLNVHKLVAALDFARVKNKEGVLMPKRDAIAGKRFALRHSKKALAYFDQVVLNMGWELVDAKFVPEDCQ